MAEGPFDVTSGPLIQAHVPNLTEPGWPKLENVGAEIVAAAAKGAEINGRSRQLERQLLALELADKNKTIEHGIAMERMSLTADIAQKNALLREMDIKSLMSERDYKQRKYYDSINDLGNYSAELAELDKNDPNWWNNALNVASKHPEGFNTPAGRRLIQSNASDFNKKTASEANAAYAEQRAVERDIKSLDWQGFPATSKPFDMPDMWQTQTKLDPATGKQVPTGNKFFPLGQDRTGQTYYLTLPETKYNEYQKRWNHSQDRLNKVGQQITDPVNQIYPYPVDPSGGGGSTQYGSAAQAKAAGHQPGETVSIYDPSSGRYRPAVLE
jgi:hypothetical protein